ncbi:hypothetical protein SERLA73DRAFT_162677 [Serpula lacrymans var. lacrymans S7.3]|uniref:Smr domain-containing protein n=2 Tax=Serpula lacrymans var. lacrymans TaxID=341189 RepID=F8Q944_SERL3|nr:uncharacterized protein SERLADRAFT_363455 [Serpula lacrymans var. lacrymans S7.9]EGN95099.1 hypothetical protein SERLA73DRAFT_162677 [Serpula lacrymans var. lacrymans S7.3]EGO20585.1 hypothetical protein SERLADRAFT_363455 [Serpula lacrymans var. lacrymans S7.9]
MPSSSEIASLRATLKELASQAEQVELELSEELEAVRLSSHYTTTEESCSTPDFFTGDTTTNSTASESSVFSHQSFSTPLGFLQAALPHVSIGRLRNALSEAEYGYADEINMESVVENILTSEYLRELEERGLDALDADEPGFPLAGTDFLWKTVESKKKSPTNGKAGKRKNVRGKTVTLVDIRQKQHIRGTPSNGLNGNSIASAPPPDPWTQLSSLSSHLATLLPPSTASFFQSYFHSPEHSSPAKALRAALTKIAESSGPSSPSEGTTVFFTMLDILRSSPAYDTLDNEQRSMVLSDARLALNACRGRGDDAIDIVWLLHELDTDFDSGYLGMGVYHQLPPSATSSSVSESSAWFVPLVSQAVSPASPRTNGALSKLSTGPPSVHPPPTSKRKLSLTSPTSPKQNPFEWQSIPPKKPPNNGVHPLADHIPAYSNDRVLVNGKLRHNGKDNDRRRQDFKRRMADSLKKRDELLREASKAWSQGNSKSRGGEVALYFAERAREFQELARREALDEARMMVESKRSMATDRNTIDLHGTCVAEAVVIAKEILEREGASPVKPLRIITGRGTHSANKTSVLKPAVKSALAQEGWHVGVWDGGLVVRGRRPGF